MSMPAPVKSQAMFLRTVPVMTVNDPERSLAFFTLLGFQVGHRETRFAIITRDAMEVHFTHHPQMRPEENTLVSRIVVSNFESLYQEILSIQALHPYLFSRVPSLTTQPQGDVDTTKRSIWLTPVVFSSGSASPFPKPM